MAYAEDRNVSRKAPVEIDRADIGDFADAHVVMRSNANMLHRATTSRLCVFSGLPSIGWSVFPKTGARCICEIPCGGWKNFFINLGTASVDQGDRRLDARHEEFHPALRFAARHGEHPRRIAWPRRLISMRCRWTKTMALLGRNEAPTRFKQTERTDLQQVVGALVELMAARNSRYERCQRWTIGNRNREMFRRRNYLHQSSSI